MIKPSLRHKYPVHVRILLGLGLSVLSCIAADPDDREATVSSDSTITVGDSATIADTEEMIFQDPVVLTGFRMRQLQRLVQEYIEAEETMPISLRHVLPERTRSSGPSATADGWGRQLILSSSLNGIELRSMGLDGILGTNDDIVFVW